MSSQQNQPLSHDAKMIVASNIVIAEMLRELMLRQPAGAGRPVISTEKAVRDALVTAYKRVDEISASV